MRGKFQTTRCFSGQQTHLGIAISFGLLIALAATYCVLHHLLLTLRGRIQLSLRSYCGSRFIYCCWPYVWNGLVTEDSLNQLKKFALTLTPKIGFFVSLCFSKRIYSCLQDLKEYVSLLRVLRCFKSLLGVRANFANIISLRCHQTSTESKYRLPWFAQTYLSTMEWLN